MIRKENGHEKWIKPLIHLHSRTSFYKYFIFGFWGGNLKMKGLYKGRFKGKGDLRENGRE